MDTSINDYLTTLDFPKLIEEKSQADCFKDFCQEYNLLLTSFNLNLKPLTENPENKQYLIIALLKTLAERENLLRHEINQMLHALIPAPENDKPLGAKSHDLEKIITLFGMKRETSIDKESGQAFDENDEALKKRLVSRLGILSNTGTRAAYTHNILHLEQRLKEITIQQDANTPGKLNIYLLPKIEIKENNKNWFDDIKPSLESNIKKKDIIPIRDEYTLHAGDIVEFNAHITSSKENFSADQQSLIKKTCLDYFEKKYRFNTIISVSELLSHFDSPLIEKLKIDLTEGEEITKLGTIKCNLTQAPRLKELKIENIKK